MSTGDTNDPEHWRERAGRKRPHCHHYGGELPWDEAQDNVGGVNCHPPRLVAA